MNVIIDSDFLNAPSSNRIPKQNRTTNERKQKRRDFKIRLGDRANETKDKMEQLGGHTGADSDSNSGTDSDSNPGASSGSDTEMSKAEMMQLIGKFDKDLKNLR